MYQYCKDGTPVYPHEAEAKAKKDLLQQSRMAGQPYGLATPYGASVLESAVRSTNEEIARLKQQLATETGKRMAAETRANELELAVIRTNATKVGMGNVHGLGRMRAAVPTPPIERRPVLIREFSAWYEEKHGMTPDLGPDGCDMISWTALHLTLLADEVNCLSRQFPAAKTNRPVEASDVI